MTTCFGPRTAAAGFTGRDRDEVLFHDGHRPGVRPDVGGDVERRDRLEPEASALAPPEELRRRPRVRRPRPLVRDPSGEELRELLHRHRPRVHNHPRQRDRRRARWRHARRRRRGSGAYGSPRVVSPAPAGDRCADHHVADDRSERPPDTVAGTLGAASPDRRPPVQSTMRSISSTVTVSAVRS